MIPLPHLTRRQLVLSLILSFISIVFLLVTLVETPITNHDDPFSYNNLQSPSPPPPSSAKGIHWVVVEKVRANFGFGSGYIPVNERPSAGDDAEPGSFDVDNLEIEIGDQAYGGGASSPPSSSSTTTTKSGLINGWNTVLNKSSSVWNHIGSKLPTSPFTNPFSGSSSSHPQITDWDDLPYENKAFKEWEYTRGLIYEGTGARLQRFLEKARSGRGFVVAVVGGSVSKGRGLPRVPYDVTVGKYVLGGGTTGRSVRSQRGDREEDEDQAGQGSTSEPQRERGKRLVSSEFPQDRDPAKTQNLYNPFNMHMQVFEFLNARFPANPLDEQEVQRRKRRRKREGRASSDRPRRDETSDDMPPVDHMIQRPHQVHLRGENQFINGAQGGVGSDYFAGCWKEHLGEDVDLVIVELGINDARSLEAMENYELLLRSLLEMGSRPAVINVQTFTLLFSTLAQASSLHIDVAAYYDTPVISLRDVLLPRILNDPTSNPAPGGVLGPEGQVGLEVKKWFRNVPEEERIEGDAKVVDGVDLMHISYHAHSLLAELVIHYLQLQIAQMEDYDLYLEEEEDESFDSDVELTDIPGMLLASAYTPNKRVRRTNPSCTSTNSAFRSRRLDLPKVSNGWDTYNWGEKRYLIAKHPGSRITFPFVTHAKPGPTGQGEGYIKIGHLRSKVLGLGSISCWVDQHEDQRTRVDGWWDVKERNMGMITTIREDLLPGHHTLTCEVLEETLDPKGGTEFRLISVLSD